MLNATVENDSDVRAALEWFAESSGDAVGFQRGIGEAQRFYRQFVSLDSNLGQDVEIADLGSNKVCSYLAQADALLHDRWAYDLVLGARIVPFIKHLGGGIEALRQMPGATERASRLLRQKTVDPDSAIFELAMAVVYAQEGFTVEFIPEVPGGIRRPDFGIKRGEFAAEVECKRLQKGDYEKTESAFQRQLFRTLAQVIDNRRLSIHVDVVYSRELKDVPADYLAVWVSKARGCRFLMPNGFPWKDEYGEGLVKPADLDAVHRDTLHSSLLFGPKLARLLSGGLVAEGAYNIAGGVKSDPRDARFVDHLYYGSVVTWQCVAEASINARARYVRSKLSEVDKQLKSSPAGIVHIGMNAERDTVAADLRRSLNSEAVQCFAFESNMMAAYLHYFVPRVTEVSAWMIDETVDRFGPGSARMPWAGRIFAKSELLDNERPAWHQSPPPPLV